MPYFDANNKHDFIRVNFKKNAHFFPFLQRKSRPESWKNPWLKSKRGIRKPNEKNKNRHERTKPLSAQYKMFNKQEQPW